MSIEPPPILYFDYVNYRGEPSHRHVQILSVRFGSSEYHSQPQWLMKGHDLGRNEEREFAMRDMTNVQPRDIDLGLFIASAD
jgi:hypothetical protein